MSDEIVQMLRTSRLLRLGRLVGRLRNLLFPKWGGCRRTSLDWLRSLRTPSGQCWISVRNRLASGLVSEMSKREQSEQGTKHGET